MVNQSRNVGAYTEIDVVKQSIDKANTANLLEILYTYNINIDQYSRKACCPFPFHKGGQERSASFYYYPDTNSFYCFGCKSGGGAVDFVAAFENVNKYNASKLINGNYVTNQAAVAERGVNNNKVYLEFSHLVRDFILKNKDNHKAVDYAEYVCAAFDSVRSRYILDPDGLNIIFSKLKKKLEDYK